jgi:hypothetical protein
METLVSSDKVVQTSAFKAHLQQVVFRAWHGHVNTTPLHRLMLECVLCAPYGWGPGSHRSDGLHVLDSVRACYTRVHRALPTRSDIGVQSSACTDDMA